MRPHLVREAAEGGLGSPTAAGSGGCVRIFSPTRARRFPDEFPSPAPPRNTHEQRSNQTHLRRLLREPTSSKSGTPVLVDYWAEWCGPCKAIAPILDEVAKDYGERLQIAKMNVDDNRDVPAKFGIRGIPTLMLFKDGQLAATKVGALSKSQLTSFLDGHL